MSWERYVPENGVLIKQREKLGLSQEEVAERAGIKLEQYKKYESSDRNHFISSSLRIVHAVLAALELDTTAFSKGDYSFEPVPEDDPLYQLQGKIKGEG